MFYYRLLPSLRDVLSFAMADLPERDQVDTSFDTLYHWVKKLEACHQPDGMKRGDFQPRSLTRATRSIPPPEDVHLEWR